MGASISIPLRIFDRNQGEKERTEIDIRRNRAPARCRGGAGLQRRGFGLRQTLNSTLVLLRPYKAKYLDEATKGPRHHRIRLSARRSFAARFSQRRERLPRRCSLSYVNLVGSYLNAASQLNLAVGREVITQ
jgi:cobalt-zinc-cadmium efflux system outer membrane protein